MKTGIYDLAPGRRPGAFGQKHVLLVATGNVLPETLGRQFVDAGVLVRAPEPEAPKEKKAPAKKKSPAKKKKSAKSNPRAARKSGE